MKPKFAKNDIHVIAEYPLCDLHGDVPGYIRVLEAVNQTNGAGNRDGAVEYAVVLRLLQEVQA